MQGNSQRPPLHGYTAEYQPPAVLSMPPSAYGARPAKCRVLCNQSGCRKIRQSADNDATRRNFGAEPRQAAEKANTLVRDHYP